MPPPGAVFPELPGSGPPKEFNQTCIHSIMAIQSHITWQRCMIVLVLTFLLLGLAWKPGQGIIRIALQPIGPGHDHKSWCSLPPHVKIPEDGMQNSSSLFQNDEALRLQVERLSALVSLPTISYDDNGEVHEDHRWKTFDSLHNRLVKLFPLV